MCAFSTVLFSSVFSDVAYANTCTVSFWLVLSQYCLASVISTSWAFRPAVNNDGSS